MKLKNFTNKSGDTTLPCNRGFDITHSDPKHFCKKVYMNVAADARVKPKPCGHASMEGYAFKLRYVLLGQFVFRCNATF